MMSLCSTMTTTPCDIASAPRLNDLRCVHSTMRQHGSLPVVGSIVFKPRQPIYPHVCFRAVLTFTRETIGRHGMSVK